MYTLINLSSRLLFSFFLFIVNFQSSLLSLCLSNTKYKSSLIKLFLKSKGILHYYCIYMVMAQNAIYEPQNHLSRPKIFVKTYPLIDKIHSFLYTYQLPTIPFFPHHTAPENRPSQFPQALRILQFHE